MELKDYRKQIDETDNELVSLLKKRMDICGQIAQYKIENNLPTYDPVREAALLDNLCAKAGDRRNVVNAVYSEILKASKELQQELRCRQKAYGLLGVKLTHSFSPELHGCFADYPYRLFPTKPDDLQAFLSPSESGFGFLGLNVTIPYKQAVIPFLSELTPLAKRIGSVNTITVENGKLIGDNTDYYGFLYTIKNYFPDVSGRKALVLGSGGASKAVSAALSDSGAKVTVISRTGENNYSNLSLHADAEIIVNTTPVGMFPDCGEKPLSLAQFSKLIFVADIIANPLRTALLLEAKQLGIPYVNGLPMLVAQAAKAAERFARITVSDEKIRRVLERFSSDRENLVLIGMPGCGKTTYGRHIANLLNRDFIDTDDLITESVGKTPSQIIRTEGEESFRKIETETLGKIADKHGCVIACGGGIVTRKENYRLIAQNSCVMFLQCDLSQLSTTDRPLSAGPGSLQKLYAERLPLYKQFADCEMTFDKNKSLL